MMMNDKQLVICRPYVKIKKGKCVEWDTKAGDPCSDRCPPPPDGTTEL